MISSFTPSVERDVWKWRESSDGIYYVSSAYSHLLIRAFPLDCPIGIVDLVLLDISCSWDPSKVIVFSWQVLQDRILTRVNLLKRGAFFTFGIFSFPFCSLRIESTSHLFVTCDIATSV